VEPIPLSSDRDLPVDGFSEFAPHHLDSAYRLAWAILGNDEEA
jgi:hypothetical protein